jgi:hypothetical protein
MQQSVVFYIKIKEPFKCVKGLFQLTVAESLSNLCNGIQASQPQPIVDSDGEEFEDDDAKIYYVGYVLMLQPKFHTKLSNTLQHWALTYGKEIQIYIP